MVVLTIGDVVGQSGCDHLRKVLPGLRKQYGADIVVANGENSAEGNGILPSSARFLYDSGVDVITSGNHVLRRRQIYDVLDQCNGLLRPANYHSSAPGTGIYYYERGKLRLCVVNLLGTVYMQPIQSPFACMDTLLRSIDTPNILVDFHAEATAEKICFGYAYDGKISAMVGTHTHVPTADARILPGGTGYITDLGMCGGINSVLGVKKEEAVYKMRTGLPTRFNADPHDVRLSGAAIEIDHTTGRCTAMEAFRMI